MSFQFNRLLCLCLTSLCNQFLPSFEDSDPELDDTQALVIICITITLTILVLCSGWCLLFKYCPSSDRVSDKAKLVTKDIEVAGRGLVNDLYRDLEPIPPPVLRMCSAPASMMGPLKTDKRNYTITIKPNYCDHKFKESFKKLETFTLPSKPKEQPKLETEV